MKFLCDSCGTKYAISDERVRGRVLKIRCKKCDFVITVREDVQAAAAAVELPSEDEGVGGERTTIGDPEFIAKPAPHREAKEADDWYVSFDGEQEGPMAFDKAVERVKKEHGSGKEAHAWRPGFMVWLPVEEVPELAAAIARPAVAPRTPVRATTPTPIGAGRPSAGVPAAQIAKDPSGPRAALAVSAGARPAARPAMQGLSSRPSTPALGTATAKPATPVAATARATGATGLPSRNGSGAVPKPTPASGSQGLFAQGGSAASPAVAPKPMFEPDEPPMLEPESLVDDDDEQAAPDLPISNEASGLVDMRHLTEAAFGPAKARSGPIMINGHTGRQPRMAPEPITAVESAVENPQSSAENPSTAAPVVVVAGAAPSGTSPLFKYAAVVALLGCGGLGIGVWYLATHRKIDTIIVTEPSRHADDSPITMTDPVTGKQVPADPKKIASVAPKKASGSPRPAATPAKPGETNLSGSQKALADLYKDDGDKATPHLGPNTTGHGTAGASSASQPAILAVVSQNRRQLTTCYERVLRRDNSLKSGRVVLQVSIGISGRVTSVVIPDAQYATSELGQCFTQAVKRWTFPANDTPYSTEFPFILQGQ